MHGLIASKNECLIKKIHLTCDSTTINVCLNLQNSAHVFPRMIDLRGHMPRFTLKMNVFPSIYSETP